MWRIIAEVTVAILAVWGIYCAVAALGKVFFVPRAYTVAVRLHSDETIESLTSRIIEARLALCGGAEPTVLLLCEQGVSFDDEIKALLRTHNGEVLLVTPYAESNANV
ncbi:MAG: hypothetical protein IJF49_03185 [Clostridia bacterium]|nr:hypothetical protein [Clostridia bacterium]